MNAERLAKIEASNAIHKIRINLDVSDPNRNKLAQMVIDLVDIAGDANQQLLGENKKVK